MGQMDLPCEIVLLFSGSCVLVCSSIESRPDISKNEHKEQERIFMEKWTGIAHLQMVCNHLDEKHILHQTEGLIFEP